MLKTRVIPTLLIRNGDLVKGSQFKNHRYVGDPINIVKIFNEKEVDELVFMDISASERGSIDYKIISDIASEAFMPFSYGGGIKSLNQIEKLFQIGVEKIIINSAAQQTPALIKDAVKIAGSQSIVLSMDVKKTLFGGYEVFTQNATARTKNNPVDYNERNYFLRQWLNPILGIVQIAVFPFQYFEDSIYELMNTTIAFYPKDF